MKKKKPKVHACAESVEANISNRDSRPSNENGYSSCQTQITMEFLETVLHKLQFQYTCDIIAYALLLQHPLIFLTFQEFMHWLQNLYAGRG